MEIGSSVIITCSYELSAINPIIQSKPTRDSIFVRRELDLDHGKESETTHFLGSNILFGFYSRLPLFLNKLIAEIRRNK
jgi:hypothetical protein